MSDESDLLAAIAAAPENDALHLIYADWLEERGDRRSELIRVQSELARMPEDDPRRYALSKVAFNLKEERTAELVAGLPERELRDAVYDRGILSEITLPAEVFIRYGQAIFDAAPNTVRGLRLIYLEGLVREVARQPALSRISIFRTWQCRMTAQDIDALADSPYLGNLTELELECCDLHTTAAVRLFASPRLTNLTSLNVNLNELRDQGVFAIARSRFHRKLTSLSLWNCEIGSRGVEALLSLENFPRLQQIDLSENGIASGSELHERLRQRFAGGLTI